MFDIYEVKNSTFTVLIFEQAIMKKVFGFLVVSMLMFSAFAQQGQESKNANQLQKRIEDLKGTYELRYLGDDRSLPMLPSNLADIIEKNRKPNEINSVLLNEKLQLIIYPANRTLPAKTN